MALPPIASRDAWLAERTALLARGKEQTRQRDALNADRRRLPMVRISKDYRFDGPDGTVGLLDLFNGRRQLVVQHVMFDPSWDEACPSCSASLDEISVGTLEHLRERETTFVAVSRAPWEKLAKHRAQRGWGRLDWYSSCGGDFNYDFHVTLDASVAPVSFNYRDESGLRAAGLDWVLAGPSEQPGVSAFLRVDDGVFHTYSTFGRGTEQLGGAYQILDLTGLGRQEEWEEPRGRVGSPHAADPSFAS